MMASQPDGGELASNATTTVTTITAASSPPPIELLPPPPLQMMQVVKDGTEATILCDLSFSDDSADGIMNLENGNVPVENQQSPPPTQHQVTQHQAEPQQATASSAAPTPLKLSCSSSSSSSGDDDSIELRLKALQLSNDNESMLAAEAFTFTSNLSGLSTPKDSLVQVTTAATAVPQGSVIGPRNLMELVACPCCVHQQSSTASAQNKTNINSSLTTINDPPPASIVASSSANHQFYSNHHHRETGTGSGGFYNMGGGGGGAAESARKAGSLLSNDSDDDEEEDTTTCTGSSNNNHHLLNNNNTNNSDDVDSEPEDVLPGVLAAGVEYNIKRILVEGWLHKKGTGKDWLGSKGWKARWARLCLARVDGFEYQDDVDVPLLLISWYPTGIPGVSSLVSTPSTVILLDSTVVLAVDIPDNNNNSDGNNTDSGSYSKERWNAHRFEIRHASTRENATMPTTRTFCAPQKARDAWLYAISQALLMHAKQKDRLRKKLKSNALLFRSAKANVVEALKTIPNNHNSNHNNGNGQMPVRPTSPVYGEVWTGDRYVTVETRSSVSNSPVHGRSLPSSLLLPSCGSPTNSSYHHGSSNNRPRAGTLSPPTSPKLPRPSASASAASVHGSGGGSSNSSNRQQQRPCFPVIPGKSSD